MAVFKRVKLFVNNDEEKDYIDFSVNAEIEYEEHEKNIEWLLIMNFFEHDTFSSDDFIVKRQRIIDPKDLDEKFEERIKRDKVDRDWFGEEVYVTLDLKPTQEFKPASITSDSVEFSA